MSALQLPGLAVWPVSWAACLYIRPTVDGVIDIRPAVQSMCVV